MTQQTTVYPAIRLRIGDHEVSIDGNDNVKAGGFHAVHTFAYDDRFRRLEDSSADLATQLSQWMSQNPGQPLRIRAHSMGGRVALAAHEEGRLTNRVTLDLIAPPLGGFGRQLGSRRARPAHRRRPTRPRHGDFVPAPGATGAEPR